MSSRIGYRLFKHYVRFCMNHIMFRRHYILGEENIPPLGEPFVVPANHQNAAIDPILMILSQDNRSHPYVLAMGGVFTWHKLINKFWDWLGMLPAFRIDFEGVEEALARTKFVIDYASGKMIDEGNPVFLFPETNHHVEHWMRVWVQGYLEIAFLAAEKTHFERDIKIVPMGHHYSSYYGLQGSYMLHYGEAISLKPYYERYKEKPRTTMRELNEPFREMVKSMMLYTDDLEHHDLYDFIRLSKVGVEHAVALGKNPDELPERLESDQHLWAELEKGVASHPETAVELTETIKEIQTAEKELHLREHAGEQKPKSGITLALSIIAQILLLPIWVFSLFPGAILYFIPPMFMPGKEDPYYKVYTQSLQFIVSVVVLIPIIVLTVLLVLGLVWGWWWQALIWIVTMFPMMLFAWYEGQWMRRTWEQISMRLHKAKTKYLRGLYNRFYGLIKKLMN